MAPTLKVIVEKLRDEATHWESNNQLCSGVSAAGDGLRMTALQAGLFFIVTDTNNKICDLVATECNRGATAMRDAADALRANATAYEAHELDVTRSIKDLGSGLTGY